MTAHSVGAADALAEPAVTLMRDPGYYVRFGFELAAHFGVVPPAPSWAPAFVLRRLTAWDPRLTGTYRYAAPLQQPLTPRPP